MYHGPRRYELVPDDSGNWGCAALLFTTLFPLFFLPAIFIFLMCGGIFWAIEVGTQLGIIPTPASTLVVPTPITIESEPKSDPCIYLFFNLWIHYFRELLHKKLLILHNSNF